MNPVSPQRPVRRGARGAVILLVLVMVVVVSSLLARLVDRVSTELVAETRAAQAARLRTDARSALEAALAVLAQFATVDGGLFSPAQGWGDPLRWAGLTWRAGLEVEVRVEDESGKPSLPSLDAPSLQRVLEHLGADPVGAAVAADAILAWTRPGHSPAFPANDPSRLLRREPPHRPAGRPLGSFAELGSVPAAAPLFLDPLGNPTALGRSFAGAVSLHEFASSNLNTASVPALVAAGMHPVPASRLSERLRGAGEPAPGGPRVFRTPEEAMGSIGEAPAGLGVTSRCLSIEVTAAEGATRLRWRAFARPAGDGGGLRVIEIRESIEPRDGT